MLTAKINELASELEQERQGNKDKDDEIKRLEAEIAELQTKIANAEQKERETQGLMDLLPPGPGGEPQDLKDLMDMLPKADGKIDLEKLKDCLAKCLVTKINQNVGTDLT